MNLYDNCKTYKFGFLDIRFLRIYNICDFLDSLNHIEAELLPSFQVNLLE